MFKRSVIIPYSIYTSQGISAMKHHHPLASLRIQKFVNGNFSKEENICIHCPEEVPKSYCTTFFNFGMLYWRSLRKPKNIFIKFGSIRRLTLFTFRGHNGSISRDTQTYIFKNTFIISEIYRVSHK